MDIDGLATSVPTAAPGGETTSYCIGRDRALLVDPATTAIDDLVADRDVAHIALTHHHSDHVGAVSHYADACEATVWARAGRVEEFVAATGVEPDRTFREGTAIPTDQGPVTVVETPGHAPEHVAFAAADWLVSGDLAVAEGSVVVGAPEGDVRAYLTSLRRLHARDPARLYPGHGPVIEDPRATCERLVRHRLRREEKVLAAVDEGASDLDAVLDSAYDKDLSGVRSLARATVRAHLEKLDYAGRLDWDGERATPL
jgi:glyoxylase-like metal-dependent hydrolase (beta-lactamase superfamily II)